MEISATETDSKRMKIFTLFAKVSLKRLEGEGCCYCSDREMDIPYVWWAYWGRKSQQVQIEKLQYFEENAIQVEYGFVSQ